MAKTLLEKIELRQGIASSRLKNISANKKNNRDVDINFFKYKGKDYGTYSASLKKNSSFKTASEAITNLGSTIEKDMKKNPNREMQVGTLTNKWLNKNFDNIRNSKGEVIKNFNVGESNKKKPSGKSATLSENEKPDVETKGRKKLKAGVGIAKNVVDTLWSSFNRSYR